MVNFFNIYELDTWSKDYSSTKFTLGDYLLGAVKLTKNADPYKDLYGGYGIHNLVVMGAHNFHCRLVYGVQLFFSDVGNNLSVHTDNKEKQVLVFAAGSTAGLDDTSITEEATCYVNITKSGNKICLSLHCNVDKSFLYGKGVNIHQFKSTLISIVIGKYFKSLCSQ